MNNEELKKNIDDAIRSGNIEKFNSAVEQAAIDKISALGLDEELRLEIRDRIKCFTVPVRLRTVAAAKESEGTTTKEYICNALVGLVFGLIMIAAVTYTGWWSVLISILMVGGYFVWIKNGKEGDEKREPEIRTVIDSNGSTVMNEIDSLIDIIRKASTKATSEEPAEPKASTLYNDYPNIVKWLQNLYAAQYEFDEAGRKYLFRHVARLLGQVYYDVVMYDGNNIALFDIDRDQEVEGTELIYPAIVDTRTGKTVLKGRVCNP